VNINLNILKILQGCLIFVWINIKNEEDNTVVKEWNEVNVSIVNNVTSESKTELRESNINIYDYSWVFFIIGWISCKYSL